MAKAKARRAKKGTRKRAQSAAQKRAQADFAAFRAVHGRGPRKGESIKGFANGAAPTRKKSKKRKPKAKHPLVRLAGWVKENPVKTVLATATAGSAGYVASDKGRREAAVRMVHDPKNAGTYVRAMFSPSRK